jgi:hypothetical protein
LRPGLGILLSRVGVGTSAVRHLLGGRLLGVCESRSATDQDDKLGG